MTQTAPRDPAVMLGLDHLVRSAAAQANVTVAVLRSRQRNARLCRVRDEAIAEAAELGISYPQIGHAFGRDHSSCINAARRHWEREGRG